MKSKITREQWSKYILDLFFGRNEPLENCINRAYRDFNRTLHGFSKLENNEQITFEIKKQLFIEFEDIKILNIKNQERFDNWHLEQCKKMLDLYSENNYDLFYFGQAQKWINMTFKYIYAYGLSGYDELYQFCHVPLDNILINELELKEFNPPKLKTSWSRIDNYQTYLEYQYWFRNKFSELPLDVEFNLWLGENL